MTIFKTLKAMNPNEFAAWLDQYGKFEDSPWMDWWNDTYCSKCKSEIIYVPAFERYVECCWCEPNNKCKFFQHLDELPSTQQIIQLWLESESIK